MQAISSADMIVVMDKGRVTWVGNSDELAVSMYSGFSSLNEFDTLHIQRKECSTSTCTQDKPDHPKEMDVVSVLDGAQDILEVEQRKEGRVELIVYK